MPTTSGKPFATATPLFSTLLLLNLPANSFIGIDLFSFTSSARFSGIKYIPSGLHHVYYSPCITSTSEKSSSTELPLVETSSFNLRSGFWFEAKGASDDIIIKKWDPVREDLVDDELSPEEALKSKANLGQIYNNSLTPYRQLACGAGSSNLISESHLWKNLTSHVSPALLDRILVGGGNSSALLSLPSALKWKIATTSCSSIDFEDDFSIHARESGQRVETGTTATDFHKSFPFYNNKDVRDDVLSLLPIHLKCTFPPDSIGRERTIAAKDRSWYLNHILSSYYPFSSEQERDSSLLGELQFCFITSFALANYSCIEQWRRILGVVLTCQGCIPLKVDLFKSVLEILIAQFRSLDLLGRPSLSTHEVGNAMEQDYSEDQLGNFLTDFLEGTGKSAVSIQKLLRSFLRTLRSLKKDDPSISGLIDDLIDVFNDLEELTQGKFDWTLDSSKVVKKGTIQLEDGEIVEMDLDELGDEDDEEWEKGEWAPMIVELQGT